MILSSVGLYKDICAQIYWVMRGHRGTKLEFAKLIRICFLNYNMHIVGDLIAKPQEVRLIYTMILKEWQVRFRHVLREQNKVVNFIAKMSTRALNVKCYFGEPPECVRALLENDIQQFRIRRNSQ
ncbi:hypothetical protein J1N35_039672 [Gossypium stocksii]|uniref:RNase H type-1 domain-containing protein n=1 Tax=Gossypium stocksii TaxID=47602 RepID=A0A9D3UCQ2_9ROSI|nr:hypothetical protein J1N35_039672 [Gossypium stocksii]